MSNHYFAIWFLDDSASSVEGSGDRNTAVSCPARSRARVGSSLGTVDEASNTVAGLRGPHALATRRAVRGACNHR